MTDTDEFRQVRDRAVEANDEQIIRDWMLEQPSYDYLMGYGDPDFSRMTEEEKVFYTLYGDYDFLTNMELAYSEEIFHVDVYIQYVVDGVTYKPGGFRYEPDGYRHCGGTGRSLCTVHRQRQNTVYHLSIQR